MSSPDVIDRCRWLNVNHFHEFFTLQLYAAGETRVGRRSRDEITERFVGSFDIGCTYLFRILRQACFMLFYVQGNHPNAWNKNTCIDRNKVLTLA